MLRHFYDTNDLNVERRRHTLSRNQPGAMPRLSCSILLINTDQNQYSERG